MATLMLQIMNDFHDLNREALDNADYEASQVFNTAESYANNCHQFTNDEILDYLDQALNSLFEFDFMDDVAIQKCLDVVKKYRQE